MLWFLTDLMERPMYEVESASHQKEIYDILINKQNQSIDYFVYEAKLADDDTAHHHHRAQNNLDLIQSMGQPIRSIQAVIYHSERIKQNQ